MSSTRKLIYLVVLIIIAFIALVAAYEIWQLQLNNHKAPVANPKTLFQVSTYSTMAAGDYDGKITYTELTRHGDFGIGAFHGMDGEMVAFNGNFYKIPIDGTPVIVNGSTTTPFAMVTFFETDQILYVQESLNYPELKNFIDNNLLALNGINAVKISGTFEYAKTRSVPLQTQPYPPLADVVANQTVFLLRNVTGTMVGYRCPSYMDGINVAGYHFHFLTDDKTAGGHMLEFITKDVTIEISHIQQYQVQQLP